MNVNHLLFWASAMGSGTWYSFKCAVERLHLEDRQKEEEEDQKGLPLYQKARLNLQRLGHVEFYCQEADWQVVPPVLAIAQRDQQARAVLCGARSEPLLARVHEGFSDLVASQTPCDGSPDVIRIVDRESARIEATAGRLGISVQPSAPEAILLNLPPLESLIQWPRTEMPFGEGWAREKFCARTLSWQRETDTFRKSGKPELLRFNKFGRPHYFVRVGESGIRVPVQLGKFVVLMSTCRRVMFYDRRINELRVPPICRPPLLVERALCLCSGFPASFDSERKLLVYKDIPEHVAQLTSRVLRQEIL